MRFRVPIEERRYGELEIDAIDKNDVFSKFYNMAPSEIRRLTEWLNEEPDLYINYIGIEEIGQSDLWKQNACGATGYDLKIGWSGMKDFFGPTTPMSVLLGPHAKQPERNGENMDKKSDLYAINVESVAVTVAELKVWLYEIPENYIITFGDIELNDAIFATKSDQL